MTVHHNFRSGSVASLPSLPSPSHLQRDLPSPPPRYVQKFHRLPSNRVNGSAYQPKHPIKRSATAPELPILSRAPSIPRSYDYSPAATVTITQINRPPHPRLLLRRATDPSRPAYLDKPLPAMPVSIERDTKEETSSMDSKSSLSTAQTSLAEPQFPEDDPLTAEFSGDVNTTHMLPNKAMLEDAADLPVLDVDGNSIPFRDIFLPKSAEEGLQGKRVMVIFIRHFFCGNCQEYIKYLSKAVPSSTLPDRTSIVLIGCGAPSLIPMYVAETSCPYQIYADPTKRLYSTLGMLRTLSLGSKDPEYIHHSLATGVYKSIVQGLSRVSKGDVTKAGDLKQVGGEFLFEIHGSAEGVDEKTQQNLGLRNARVTWCHRMRNTRDHAEISVIQKTLKQELEQEKRQSVANTETTRPQRERRSTLESLKRSMSKHMRRRSSLRGAEWKHGDSQSPSASRRETLDSVANTKSQVKAVDEIHRGLLSARESEADDETLVADSEFRESSDIQALPQIASA